MNTTLCGSTTSSPGFTIGDKHIDLINSLTTPAKPTTIPWSNFVEKITEITKKKVAPTMILNVPALPSASLLTSIEYLCFSGGGFKGYVYEGIIKALEHKCPGFLKRQKGFVGTSIGAFVSLFLTMGGSPEQIKQYLDENKLNLLNNLDFSKLFWNDSSITNPSLMANFVRKTIVKMLGSQHLGITFEQLFQMTGRELCVGVTNVSRNQFEYHSHKTTPNHVVALSVQASMSIPCVFSSVAIDGDVCIDGGFLCNTPIDYFPIDKTLVFLLHSTNDRLFNTFKNSTSTGTKNVDTNATAATFVTSLTSIKDVKTSNAVTPSTVVESTNNIHGGGSDAVVVENPFAIFNLPGTLGNLVISMMDEIVIRNLKNYTATQLERHVVFLDTKNINVLSLTNDPKVRETLNEIGYTTMLSHLALLKD